jgi:hypothetical protein
MFSFWTNCLQRDKRLFLIFLVFIAGQTVFIVKGVETFPFWNYGMYSASVQKPKQLEVKKIIINDIEFDLNSARFSKVFMEYQLSNDLKSEKFGPWVKQYFERHSKVNIGKASVQIQLYNAEKPYNLIQSDEYPIYEH